MTAAIFAILSSITFGSADFLGGLATRRAALIAVMLGNQAAAFLTLLLAAAIVSPFWLPPHDLALSILAGISTSIGIPMLYRGLAIGPMSIVAPVTALVAMLLPVLYGMAILGEAPPNLTLLGFALAAVAVFLLGGGEKLFESLRPTVVRQATPLRAFAYALGSGSCIAIFYVATRSCSAESGLWPLVGARLVAFIAMAALALIRRRDQPLAWPGALLLVFILLSGSLDGAGNAFYIVAAHGGDLGVVATITSLYPATTILLARYALAERISLAQTIGVVSALAAIVAIIWGLQVPA
jgi:uncharacterized membrane protein